MHENEQKELAGSHEGFCCRCGQKYEKSLPEQPSPGTVSREPVSKPTSIREGISLEEPYDLSMFTRGLLCDKEIKKRITILPLAEQSRYDEISYGLSSYGYDFRLGYKFAFPKYTCPSGYIDPKATHTFECFTQTEIHQPFLLKAKTFILAESLEYFRLPRDVMAICVGKSTYARNGIIVFVTPLEPEWSGKLTVEIFNSNDFPVRLYPGEGLAQLIFFSAEEECTKSYADRKNAHYKEQPGLVYSCVPFSKTISNGGNL